MSHPLDGSCAIVDANYHEVAPPYRGNPFVEALPQFRTTGPIFTKLRKRPPYDAAWRELPEDQRLEALSGLKQIYEPLSRDIDYFRRLKADMAQSYMGRGATDPNYFAKVVRQNEPRQPEVQRTGSGRYHPAIQLLVGLPGAGKSVAMEQWLSLIPRAIRHTSYQGRPFMTTQVPWLYLRCPGDGSPKALCTQFFQEFDALLGTNYLKNFNAKTAEGRLPDMARLCALHGTALVVIDNVENLSKAKSGGERLLTNFLYDLPEELGAVLALVGTYEALPLLSQSLRQIRRESELGWQPWERIAERDWKKVLRAVWSYQLTATQTDLTASLEGAMYQSTLGIPDFIWILYKLTQERAITTRAAGGKETITPDMILSVAADYFGLLQGAIDALRRQGVEITASGAKRRSTMTRKSGSQLPDLTPSGLLQDAMPSPRAIVCSSGRTDEKTNTETHSKKKTRKKRPTHAKNPDPTALTNIADARGQDASVYDALTASGTLIDKEWT